MAKHKDFNSDGPLKYVSEPEVPRVGLLEALYERLELGSDALSESIGTRDAPPVHCLQDQQERLDYLVDNPSIVLNAELNSYEHSPWE